MGTKWEYIGSNKNPKHTHHPPSKEKQTWALSVHLASPH